MKAFHPQKLPLKNINWESLIHLISSATRELARFEGLLQSIPNPAILLSPLSTQEAVLSSRIEGTQATLEEVLEFGVNPDQYTKNYNDINEVLNYRKAVYFAVKELENKPINLNLIKKAHAILLDSVRGKDKARGEFRKTQNWIGKPGTSIEHAFYIPPDPLYLMEYLDNFEKYIHYEEKDRLVQLAIVHAQFELIHPFLDGNGRIGRILIPLFLYEKQLLSEPIFYISAYFEKNRNQYYNNLRAISDEDKWAEWIQFFLNAIIIQSKNNCQLARKIMEHYNAMKEVMVEKTHSQFSIKTLDFIFCKPIFSSTDFQKKTKIPKPSANRILLLLKAAGIINTLEKGKGRKSTTFCFKSLLDIIDEI